MASRNAVMISGERNANCANSFLRSAGASCAAAALRWMTRPARSSSTAGSGMQPTMALTAGLSTGLAPRTSSRDATVVCSRHGTSAAAAMQTNTAAARNGDNSPKATRKASASPAASRMMAARRKRSGHGENREEEASIAIGPDISAIPSHSSAAGVAAFPDIGGFARRSGVESRRRLAQAFHSRAQDNLPERQQDYRYDERRNIIQQADQRHSGQQVFPVHLPQPDQHGGVEYAEAAGGMAGETQQRRRDKDHRDDDETEIGFVRHQHIHRERAETEIEDADRDLQQGQRAAGQHHRPGAAADGSRLHPDPGHVCQQPGD